MAIFCNFLLLCNLNKICVQFNLTSFGTEKYDCVKKQREIFNFLHLINKSLIIFCAFLSDITCEIMSSNTINTSLLLFLL